MEISALTMKVQNILEIHASRHKATQTSGMSYKLKRKEMWLCDWEGMGYAVMATVESQLSQVSTSIPNPGNCGRVFCSSTSRNNGTWTIDSRVTDHMTLDLNDFSNTTQPRRRCIANANGATDTVTGVGTVPLSLPLSLSHTPLVPSLLNKLMFVSEVTK